LLKRFLGINEHGPFAVAQDKVVCCLMAGGLALPGS
jgi:hypothetical protein